MRKIVCELSGGADSVLATCLAQFKYGKCGIYAVFVDYGQVCMRQELNCAKLAAKKLEIPLKIIKIRGVWGKGGMIDGETEDSTDVYTPLRNLVIMGGAIGYAESIGADIVVTGSKGFSKTYDEHSYLDSTLSFYSMMEGVWRYASEKSCMRYIDPILAVGRTEKMSKKEVYEQLLEFGFEYDDTWSCFKGGNKECGRCHNCTIKKRIFDEIEVEDENTGIKI